MAQGRQRPGALSAPEDQEFDAFFRANWDRMIKHVSRKAWGATIEDVEDATSYAMTQLYERWSTQERPTLNPQGWVFKVAMNKLAEISRRRSDGWQRHVTAALADAAPAPEVERRVILQDETSHVMHLISRLPEGQRTVMAFLYDGYAPTEIATMARRPVATVRSNLRHARARLTRELRTYQKEPLAAAGGSYAAGHPL
ncbi:sigma-70 family RNA polymerase sigma factor [Polymorphospora sp. NPDC050346]|uniref:RNA polymerase sigma factor n=1 Tax=Polymorphospora sp. NPDC050346 TaxID=3155780 RepID=UPI0033F65476